MMKLSEMKTKEAARMLCTLTGPIDRIAHDEQIIAQLKNRDKKTLFEAMAGLFSAFVPALLDRHYEDTLTVISAMTGKGKDVLEDQTIVETMNDAKGILDDDLIRFFTSSARTADAK